MIWVIKRLLYSHIAGNLDDGGGRNPRDFEYSPIK